MNALALLRTHLSLALLIVLSFGMLATVQPTTSAAASCPGGMLAEKSAAGLMPPACSLDPDAPAPTMLMASAASTVDFLGAPSNTPVGSWAQLVTAADLNNDQVNEAAVGTAAYFDAANDWQIHLLKQVGTTFERIQQRPAQRYAEAIVAFDANLDGLTDLAVAGETGVSLITQATGGVVPLNEPSVVLAGQVVDALTVGDIDGDLHPDLIAVVPQGDTMLAWASSTTGLHAYPVNLNYPTEGYSALASGDLNNDGQDDLVALRGAGYTSDSVAVFLQRGSAVLPPLLLSPVTGGYLPHSLTVGDVNSDGLDDLVVTAGGNTPEAYLNVFLQGPTGLSTTPVTYPAFHLPSAVAIADITHDGREDVVVTHDGWRTLSVYPQNAAGTLNNYVVATIPYSSRYRPNALALADFNGDGGLDAAVVSREAGLTTLSNTVGAPSAQIHTPADATHIAAGSLTVAGTVGLDATGVQVRIKGLTSWQEATLMNGTWEMRVSVPTTERAWVVEARAVRGDRFQAPPSRHHIQVGPTAFAVADNGGRPDPHDYLMRVNLRTAETTLVGGTGRTEIHSLAFKTGTLQLYTADNQQLGTLDLVTGVFSPTSATFGKGSGIKGQITFSAVNGLAFDPSTDVLYAVQRRTGRGNDDILFQVDPTTGAHVPDAFGAGQDYVVLDGPNVPDDIDDIAFDPLSGRLYGVANNNGSGDKLVRIALDSGNIATAVHTSLDVQNVEGMTFSNSGQMYGTTGITRSDTRNRLWKIDTSSGATANMGLLTGEYEDYEGIACAAAGLTLPSPLAGSAQVQHVALEGGRITTATPSVRLSARTAGASDRQVLFVEYTYEGATQRWVPAQPEALTSAHIATAEAAAAGVELQLSTAAGIKYIQAWAVDREGHVAPTAQQTFVNHTPVTSTIKADQTQVYRYALRPGEQVTMRLEMLEGDADLYIWPSDPDASALVSNLTDATDEVTFVAETEQIYQVEVYGATASTYRLTMTVVPVGDSEQTMVSFSGHNAMKLQRSEPAIPLASAPDLHGPFPDIAIPQQQQLVYLPLLAIVDR